MGFWSTSNPCQRTKYHCRISLILPEIQKEMTDRNFVINHQSTPDLQSNEFLQDFTRHVREVNEKENIKKERELRNKLIEEGKPLFEILSPKNDVLKKLGKHLNYESLHEVDKDNEAHLYHTEKESFCILEGNTQRIVDKSTVEKNEIFEPEFIKKPLNRAVSNVINRISPNKNSQQKFNDIHPQKC